MSVEAWKQFEEACSACTKCALSQSRTQVVLGRGTTSPVPVLLVGEGPGEQEDQQGMAFVGRAGHLLDLVLTALQYPEDAW